MSAKFVIDLEWEGGEYGSPEVRATAALLRISVADQFATRSVNNWSRTVGDFVRVSAYPLALWFARSWWRIRWEPYPLAPPPSTSWRMAHEMPAVGHGYLWPHMSFASDGEYIEVSCQPSPDRSVDPLRYLSRLKETVGANTFTSQLDAFISLVLARLDAEMPGAETELHRLWAEVKGERQDESAEAWRKLEAQLGYDPDEAPDQVMQDLQDLAATAGTEAASEIAPILSRDDPRQSLQDVMETAQAEGIEGCIAPPIYGRTPRVSSNLTPWERGRVLAKKVRKAWDVSDDVVSDNLMAELLGIPEGIFASSPSTRRRHFGLAIRHNNEKLKILFRRPSRTGMRFEAARYLADYLTAPTSDSWLPVTDSKTARQKTQRAFAAEFLCPIDLLKSHLGSDFSDYSIEDAADHFGVTPLTIKSHLANHKLLSPEEANG